MEAEDGGQRSDRITRAQLEAIREVTLADYKWLRNWDETRPLSPETHFAVGVVTEWLADGLAEVCDLAFPPVESNVRTGFLSSKGLLDPPAEKS
jgi:hypothetical protein